MAKKKRSGGRRGFTLPIAPIAGLAAGLIGPATRAMGGDYQGAFEELSHVYTGYHPRLKTFDFSKLQHGLLPLIIGAVVHKYVGGPPLNVNRMLAQAGVPVLRI